MSAPLIIMLSGPEAHADMPLRVDVPPTTRSRGPDAVEPEHQFSVEWEVPEAS